MRASGLACLAAAAASLAWAGSASQTPVGNPIWSSDFRRVVFLSSTVVGDYLYLDGGELRLTEDDYTSGSTLRIDLTKSWTNVTLLAAHIDKPVHFRYARFGLLWSDGSNLYTYGGIPYFFPGCTYACSELIWDVAAGSYVGYNKSGDVDPQFRNELRDLPATLYKLPLKDFEKSTWVEAGRRQQPPSFISEGQGAIPTIYGDKMYALGGFAGSPYADSSVDPVYPVPGIASWNLDASGWQNRSSKSFQPDGSTALGVGIAAPFGSEGIIIYIGGYAPKSGKTYHYGATTSPIKGMSQIDVYDIATGQFMSQTATGDIPEKRWSFCAVGASESGSGTFDIYIHGGFNTVRLDDIVKPSLEKTYVLSLPEFIWTEIPHSKQTMRSSPTCQLIGRSQMVVIGGSDPTDSYVGQTADPWTNGIGIFDLNTWSWASKYDPSAASYKRPQRLASLYTTHRYPRTWASPALKALFQNTTWHYTPPSRGPNTSAIAGGVVGGLVALALIISAFFFYRWKQRPTRRESEQPSISEIEGGAGRSFAELPPTQQPSELPAGKGVAELGPPPAWELEPSEKAHSSAGSAVSKMNDDEATLVHRYEMEG